MNRKKIRRKRCRTTLFLICVITFVFFIHGCAVKPKLIAEDRKKDIEYLAQWATDYSPFVKLNEKHKGIPSHEALKPKYLELAEQAKNNKEFLQVVYGYFNLIGASGHAYLIPEDELSSYISGTQLREASYWSKLFYDTFFARPPFLIISKGGVPPFRTISKDEEYFTGDKWRYNGNTIPKRSKILKINGMTCSSYQDHLKKNTWLSYTAGNSDWLANELLIINEGENFKGWQVDFLLPEHNEVQTFVPAKKGFFPFPQNGFVDAAKNNCVCLELAEEVGYIRIKTFPRNHTKEGEKIRKFLDRPKGSYNKLIIDVRNNRGGLPVYFYDNLIRPFLNHPVTYKQITGIKRKFLADNNRSYHDFLRSPVLLGCPQKVKEVKAPIGFDSKEWIFYEVIRELKPTDSYNFNGDIFVLINEGVGSAADDYANAIERIQIATLVGRNTWGSSAAYFQPVAVRLPASGIMFRLEVDLVLNPDGSCNELVGTTPDIKLHPTFLPEVITKEALLKDEWVRKIIDEL